MSKTLAVIVGEMTLKQQRLKELTDPSLRAKLAQEIVGDCLFVAARIAGEDVIRTALGDNDTSTREGALESIITRSTLATMFFGSVPADGADLMAVADEAWSIINGDPPTLFAKIADKRKKAIRLTRAKFSALLWDIYLSNHGVSVAERHGLIAIAYGHDWDTISRWIKPVRSKLKDVYVDYFSRHAAAEGRDGLPFTYDVIVQFKHPHPYPDWRDGLAHSGKSFIAALHQNASDQ